MNFKDLLTKGVVAPGVWDAGTALLAKQAGFECVYQSGYAMEATQIGAPDLGLITLTEVASQATRIIAATDLPVVADIDTGFGGINNLWRTVRTLEAAGVAAVHLEDQTSPKRCASIAPTTRQSRGEAVHRIEAAVDARRSNDFIIIGRTDDAGESFEEMVIRSNLYLAAGADVAMPVMLRADGVPLESMGPDEQMQKHAELAAAIDGPVCWSNKKIPRGYKAEDMIAAGYSIIILAGEALEAAVTAVSRLYRTIIKEGSPTPYFDENPSDIKMGHQLATEVLDLDSFIKREKRFLPPDL
jgi:methylisocitrate lyase